MAREPRELSVEERAARRAGLAVALAVSLYGISFGALSVASGLTIWQTCVLSLFMFSGGSQFALIGVLASGGTSAAFTAVVGAALLGTRNSLYAIRMSPIVGGPLWRRVLAAQFTVDETTAVATAQPTLESQRAGFWWTAVSLYLGWNVATLIGALIGNAIGDVRAYGLDAAAAAAFLGLLWPRLKALQPVVVAVGAAVVAAVLTPTLPVGVPILVAALVAILVGAFNWFGKRGGVVNFWTIILLASVCVLALKVLGYLVPPSLVEKPGPARISNLLTIALLAGLTAVETVGDGQHVVIDARVPAVLVAAGLFALRVPFVLVIVAAAVVAALIRLLT